MSKPKGWTEAQGGAFVGGGVQISWHEAVVVV